MADYAEELARVMFGGDVCDPLERIRRVECALTALRAIAATGCKVVRREPTEEMLGAVRDGGGCDEGWIEMSDAAPAFPEDR